jgi:pimeloyl-ACP methyl ester carboxylesterase
MAIRTKRQGTCLCRAARCPGPWLAEKAVDLDSLDFVARSGELDTRILLLHSDDDGYVPSVSSRKLAELRPDIVTFVPFSIARHTKLWNYDPERWNEAIRAWLHEA